MRHLQLLIAITVSFPVLAEQSLVSRIQELDLSTPEFRSHQKSSCGTSATWQYQSTRRLYEVTYQHQGQTMKTILGYPPGITLELDAQGQAISVPYDNPR